MESGCVMAHEEDVWPICETIHDDKIGLATIVTKVHSNLLEGTRWTTLADNRLLRIRWKMILAMFTWEYHVFYVIIHSRPFITQSNEHVAYSVNNPLVWLMKIRKNLASIACGIKRWYPWTIRSSSMLRCSLTGQHDSRSWVWWSGNLSTMTL